MNELSDAVNSLQTCDSASVPGSLDEDETFPLESFQAVGWFGWLVCGSCLAVPWLARNRLVGRSRQLEA
jgi:hypothetical protein